MKNLTLKSLCVLFLFASSCRTVIPTRDTVEPNFNFHISGDGFSKDINQDFDFDDSALYLRRNAIFNVIYSGNDEDGLKEFTIELPNSPYIKSSYNSGLLLPPTSGSRYNVKYGSVLDASNPISGAVIRIERMKAVGDLLNGVIRNFEIIFYAKDYHDNEISKTLVVRITNQSTAIRPRD